MKITNPEPLYAHYALMDTISHKPGDMFDVPEGLEFENKGVCCSPIPGINHHSDCDRCDRVKTVLRLVPSKKEEKEPNQKNKELWKHALQMSGSHMDPIKWLSDNFTITRN